jgi:putative acetyltransferase
MAGVSSGLRPMQDGDVAALALIFHRAVQEGSAGHYDQAQRDDWSPAVPSTAGWAARLEGFTTFVAESGGVPVGFVATDAQGLVDLLFVRPDQARRGIGTALLAQATEAARAAGLRRLTAEASALSEGLFRKAGWQETGLMPRGAGAGRVVNRLFARNL